LKRFRLSDGGKWLARPASSIKYEFIRSVPIQGAGRQLQLRDLNREFSFLNLSLNRTADRNSLFAALAAPQSGPITPRGT
jgi:hypothetical protein